MVNAIDLNSWTTTIDQIAKELHNGKLKPSDLHAGLITKTYIELEKGAAEGYGKGWELIDPINSKTVQHIKQNIYKFSGAKTYQQLAEMNSFLVDEKGKIRSYSEFKRKVDAVHQNYNRNYLQAEYQTSKRAAQSVRQWKEFEANKDLFPNLKYMTVGDDRVRHDHEKLHGIIKPVDHPFWNTHNPPNGWRCRCYLVPTTEKETTEKTAIEPDKGFAFNPGKINKLFDENNHPYFVFPAGDAKAVKKAFENFKLTASYGKATFTAKNGAKVFVSPFADPADLFGNYRTAIKLANADFDVKIRPHVNIKGVKNPEYVVNKLITDRAQPKKLRGILTAFDEKINDQNCEAVVLDFTYKLKNESRFNIAKTIRGGAKVNKKLKEVILVFGDEIINLNRSEMFSDALWQKVIKKATK